MRKKFTRSQADATLNKSASAPQQAQPANKPTVAEPFADLPMYPAEWATTTRCRHMHIVLDVCC